MAPPRLQRFFALATVLCVCAALLAGCQLANAIGQLRYPLKYTEEVERWAGEYGVDPYLVYAVMRTESGFDPKAESDAGARGLMQMTEETLLWLAPKIVPGEALPTFDDLYTPDVSIRFGTYFLSLCLARYGGDIPTAAAAYHSGWGTVDALLAQGEYTKDGVSLTAFPYTQMAHYVNKVGSCHAQYLSLYGGTAAPA